MVGVSDVQLRTAKHPTWRLMLGVSDLQESHNHPRRVTVVVPLGKHQHHLFQRIRALLHLELLEAVPLLFLQRPVGPSLTYPYLSNQPRAFRDFGLLQNYSFPS